MSIRLSESTIRRHIAFAKTVGDRIYIPDLMEGMTWTEAQEQLDDFVEGGIRREEHEEAQRIKKGLAAPIIKLKSDSTGSDELPEGCED